jgi:oligopeptide/dipeptide ABC transporter ATP-binding protein
LESVPTLDADKDVELKTVDGQTPSPADVTVGCEFAGRCPLAIQKCKEATIEMRTFGANHQARCIRLDDQGNLPALVENSKNV